MIEVVGLLLAGFASGFFSGALGIGGAVVATPLIRLVGVSAYLAVGSTVPALLPSTLTGAYTYWRRDLTDRRAAAAIAPTAAITSVLGALSTRRFDGHVLMLATAALLLILALRVLPGRKDAEFQELDGRPSRPRLMVLGAVTGFMSGLLGVGGGFLIVPVLIKVFHYPVKRAIGTSLLVIAVTVLPNLVTQAFVGNIDWRVALLLTIAVVPGARLGATLSIRAPERRLRVVVAVALSIIAIAHGTYEIAALSSA